MSTVAPLVLATTLALAACALCACTDEGSSGAPPILEDPLEAKHTCTITRPLENRKPPYWGRGHGLVAAGGRFLLARTEVDDPFLSGESVLMVSEVSAAGERDRRALRAAPASSGLLHLALAATASAAWAEVYLEGDTVHLAHADGARVEDRALVARDENLAQAQLLARASGGWLYVWSRSADYQAPLELRLLVLDAQGAAAGSPRTLATARRGGYPLRFALAPGALLFADEAEDGWRLSFAALSDDGALGDARLVRAFVQGRGSFSFAPPSLLPVAGGYVAAWAETTGEETVSTVVWMVRLDASGGTVGEPRPLTAREESIEHVEPELFALGDDVVVLWSRGSVIYECGGCIPDHDLRMVVLSAELHPRSAVLELPYDGPGGLLRHTSAAIGADVAIASDIQFHTTEEPAIGFARCQ